MNLNNMMLCFHSIVLFKIVDYIFKIKMEVYTFMLEPTTKDIIRIVRTYAYQNGITVTEFAREADVSKSWISRLKNEDADISLELAKQMLSTAGYKIIVKHQSDIDAEDSQKIKTLTDEQIKQLEKQKKK